MNFTNRQKAALKNTYVVAPDSKSAKGFVAFREGHFSDVPSDCKNNTDTLFIRRGCKEDFESLFELVVIEVAKAKLTGAPRSLAEAIIYLACSSRNTGLNVSVEHLISDAGDVAVSSFLAIPMYIVMAGDMDSYLRGARVGRFQIGGEAMLIAHKRKLNDKVIDFGAYGAGLGFPAVWMMREPALYKVTPTVFDPQLPSLARDKYLAVVTNKVFADFKRDLADDLCLTNALGAPIIDGRSLLSAEFVQLLADFDGKGEFSGTLVKEGHPSFPKSLKDIQQKSSFVKGLLGDKPFKTCKSVDKALESFSNMVTKARIHEAEGRSSDAFIHCVFALDIVLGGARGGLTTNNITKRAAAIVSCLEQKPFRETKKIIEDLYNRRSRYVHDGKEISTDQFNSMIKICSQVAECLLRARHTSRSEDEDFIERFWQPRLDLVAAALFAEIGLNDKAIFEESGLPPTPV